MKNTPIYTIHRTMEANTMALSLYHVTGTLYGEDGDPRATTPGVFGVVAADKTEAAKYAMASATSEWRGYNRFTVSKIERIAAPNDLAGWEPGGVLRYS